MSAADFRKAGHTLIDRLADLMESMADRPVTSGKTPLEIRDLLDADANLPSDTSDAGEILAGAADLVIDHSLYNGHPRFWGYITSSPAPIGVLGDLIASAVNPNVGAWGLAPVATEIEAQSIRWIAELLDYPADCGGILVSGGNMANFVCFLAARAAKADWDIRKNGATPVAGGRLRIYASAETHTWIQKAADLFGLGTESIRWISTDNGLRIDTELLQEQIDADRADGDRPFLLIGTAGSVSTGAIDPLADLATIARKNDLWYHVDGAYGGFAAAVPSCKEAFNGMSQADSIAVDPHKWLYAPLEAGCALVRNPKALQNAFSYHPPYYHFDTEVINYFDYGPQNSRGFRALKVWLGLKQAGRSGYVRMIEDDITLARSLYDLLGDYPELEKVTHDLSITTFRYIPEDLNDRVGEEAVEEYLNRLNEEIRNELQQGGEAFLSHAVIRGKFVLRLCIVNFRTTIDDIRALPEIVLRLGAEIDGKIRKEVLG
jgi:glutamate/tyrosine decarboxylase-like PLP-dependent enzyme